MTHNTAQAIRDRAHWRKPSYSTPDGVECVEVADLTTRGLWAIRDSKNRTGPALMIPRTQWGAFTASVRASQL